MSPKVAEVSTELFKLRFFMLLEYANSIYFFIIIFAKIISNASKSRAKRHPNPSRAKQKIVL